MFGLMSLDWFHIMIILAILMILILILKQRDLSHYYEGFVQDTPYVYKKGIVVYDDFYADIYNKLMKPEKTTSFQIDTILQMTQPSSNNCAFLDICAGTGETSGALTQKGYTVYALDISKDMTNYIEDNHPKVQAKCGDARDPIQYEKESFSHIICNGLGIYHFQDKAAFFQNCFFWMRPGGYLAIHLVDPQKFDTIVPGGRVPVIENPQRYASKRITDTHIDFIDFSYRGVYDFRTDNKNNHNQVTFRETFTDALSKNVRQQETVYYMDSISSILQCASDNGFVVHGQVNFSSCCDDEHQHLFILERTH